jgi:hypothetical protein
MPTRAPDETDILCENCGYMLNGLPPSGNCPECGSPIDLSTSAQFRQPPPWEDPADPRPRWRKFLVTTAQIIFRPTRFYKSFKSRGDLEPAFRFARIHWIIAAVLYGTTVWIHWGWSLALSVRFSVLHNRFLLLWPAICFVAYVAIRLTIIVAAWLTNLEASYRGYRLPIRVVRRAMYYNAAHLIPVGTVILATVAGYVSLQEQNILGFGTATTYLYVLAGEIIFAAGYLFTAYWIAMSNLMYANH